MAQDAGAVDSGLSPLDAGGPTDAGRPDAQAPDSGAMDSGRVDTGVVDSGPTDTGVVDSGLTDTGVVDSGPSDTGVIDSGPTDAGPTDAGPTDAGSVACTNGGGRVIWRLTFPSNNGGYARVQEWEASCQYSLADQACSLSGEPHDYANWGPGVLFNSSRDFFRVRFSLKFHDQQGATIRFCWASLRLNQVRSDYIVFRRLNARV